ncbi:MULTISPECIES: gamma-glutamyl-gamma-aminobutyrate hydrolase family protein [Halomonadaceae]|jgi:putative glutamine amidotransferase|uniref:Putative glutamine amidotransferase n=1 Tax=Onishia taeanensis TaxID=284577 RepID=A0A328Y1G3_9GAMM|nr:MULTISPECIES: gamma-glutamyl-gamma-aminobutyrate hydrolase family protein [Halomonas]MDI4638231.1 gamma-glutamyl-gamma-aminobutyrate hydrolase family protein [Halomonas sp. BMC7]NUJ59231.1 gamma-glutamyl-gamma-aminobutyrate hydrolase family protein [Halomonas taeanensis]RAR62908.1 putative glutamine amidotransferase [Halomonas taeanensis]
MTRPLIGITTSDRKSRLAWFFDWLAVWRHGGRPLRLSPSRPVPETLDGLIIGGGDDIEAHLYGGEVRFDVRVDPERDALELDLLERFIPSRCPVLGICRGAQLINVYMGGTLDSDIYTTYEGLKRRRTVLPRKTVDIVADSKLHRILGVSWCRINSLHHQAVQDAGRGIEIVARDRDGLVQGIESREHDFLMGVQWHPEWLIFNRPQQRLIRALVDAAA